MSEARVSSLHGGWSKEIALQRRPRHRGKERVGCQVTLAAAADNLIRLPKLLAVA